MTTIHDVVAHLDATFHPELQESYDNSGFLVGNSHDLYRGALVALDLTEPVIEEAEQLGLNLIVTHHPFLFGGTKRLTDLSTTGRMALRLIRSGIAVYAAHTNLDNLSWGVNGVLADRLGLRNTRILKPLTEHPEAGAGIVGELGEAIACDQLLLQIKQLLGQPTLRCSHHDAQRLVRRVALCGGSGAFLIPDALATGADLYLTADLKYHDFQRTDERMVLCDAGHYESEQLAKEIIFLAISEKFSNFACRISELQGSIVCYI